MQAEEFVKGLSELAPSESWLQKEGLSLDDATKIRSSFVINAREGGVQYERNPLLDLGLRFDASNVEIGMIRFGGEGIETDDGWLVGKVEADDLLLKRFSGQVIVHEFGEIDHTLWKCAMSGGGFLDAVLKTAFYLERFARDESLSDDEHARTQAAHVCASLAGGEKCLEFYEMLLC